MKKISLIVFVFSVPSVVLAELLGIEMLFLVTKPLILTSLIAYYYFSLKSENRSVLLILALMLSLAGDVLLMKAGYFIPGLVAFLAAHVVYIFVYRQHRTADHIEELQGVHRIRLAFPIVLAGTGLVVVLYPRLGDLRIPVIVYAMVITIMTLTALFRYGRTTNESFWLVFLGAIAFMISDSLLAINKFMSPFDYAGIFIMVTYSLAQLMIVRGLMKHPVEQFS